MSDLTEKFDPNIPKGRDADGNERAVDYSQRGMDDSEFDSITVNSIKNNAVWIIPNGVARHDNLKRFTTSCSSCAMVCICAVASATLSSSVCCVAEEALTSSAEAAVSSEIAATL